MLKSRDSTLLTKVHIVKAMVFSNSHARMWELDHKQGWVLKNWCFQTVVLEKTLESPLPSREIKPGNPKGNQNWNIHWKDWCWSSNTLATWCEELTPLKSPWCWQWLKVGGEGDDRGWSGWMASLTQVFKFWVFKPRELVMDREAWHAAVRGVTKSWTWLSNWTELNC